MTINRPLLDGLAVAGTLLLLLALLPAAVAVAQSPQPGELVINEIMIDPEAVWDTDGEYIEIYNNTAHSISFWNCKLLTQSGSQWTYALNYTIAARDYLLLGINGNAGTNGGVGLDIEYTGLTLLNTADSLTLEWAGTTIDSVAWNMAQPAWSNTPGRSLQLADPYLDNADGRFWLDSWTLIAGAGSDYGTPGTINEATANFAPDVLLNTTPGTLSGTGLLDFQLKDPEGDTCDVVVEFSRDGGGTWADCAPGAGGDPLTGIATTATYETRTFAWDTWADLVGISAAETVKFRITAWDYKPGQTSPAMVDVTVDNSANQRPSIGATITVAGDHGVVTLGYTLADPDGDLCAILAEYSADGGVTWRAALGADGHGDGVTGVAPGSRTLAWNSLASAAGATGPQTVRVRLTPTDIPSAPTLVGTPGTTPDFAVDNAAGVARVLDVVISEVLATPQATGDPAGEWLELANTLPRLVQLNGWTVADAVGGSYTLATDLALPAHGRVVIGYTTVGAQNGNAGVSLAYGTALSLELDGALTLHVGGRVIDAADWDAGSSFPYQAGRSIERANPASDASLPGSWALTTSAWPGSPGDTGTPGTAASPTGTAPTVAVTTLARLDAYSNIITYTGSVIATFTPADADGDRVTALWEYSTTGAGGPWSAATLSPLSPMMNGLTSGTMHTFVWDSIADGVGVAAIATAVRLRVSVRDSRVGGTATMTEDIVVDSRPNDAPVLTITGLADAVGTATPLTGEVRITFDLADDEADAVWISAEHSTDGGTTWFACSENTAGSCGTGPLVSSGTQTYTFNWSSTYDRVGLLGATNVDIRVIPQDWAHPVGGPPGTASTQVQNMAAPNARIGTSGTLYVNDVFFVSGALSTGSVATYAWSFGNGESANGEVAATVYRSTGDYTITLTVDGPMGADTTHLLIRISEPGGAASGGGCGITPGGATGGDGLLLWLLMLALGGAWRRRVRG